MTYCVYFEAVNNKTSFYFSFFSFEAYFTLTSYLVFELAIRALLITEDFTWCAGISSTILHQHSLLFVFEVHCHGFTDAKWWRQLVWTRNVAHCTLLTGRFFHWAADFDVIRTRVPVYLDIHTELWPSYASKQRIFLLQWNFWIK